VQSAGVVPTRPSSGGRTGYWSWSPIGAGRLIGVSVAWNGSDTEYVEPASKWREWFLKTLAEFDLRPPYGRCRSTAGEISGETPFAWDGRTARSSRPLLEQVGRPRWMSVFQIHRVPPGCPSSAEFDGMGWNRKEESGTTN